MAKVTITGPSVRDSTTRKDNRPWYAWAAEYQDGGDGGVITPRRSRPIYPSQGVLSLELEAGIATWIQNPDGNKYLVTVPESNANLWDVIASAVAYPPDTRSEILATAVGQYVEDNADLIAVDDVVSASGGTAIQFRRAGQNVGSPIVMTVATALANPTAVKTAAYTAAGKELVPCDATSGGFTVTLPASPVNGDVIAVKKLDATANTVTVQRSGSDVFNRTGGPSTLQLVGQDETVIVQYQSGIWYVIYHGIPLVALDQRYSGFITQGADLKDINSNVIVEWSPAASAVNHLKVGNSATTVGRVNLEAVGTDSNIGIWLILKGTGKQFLYSPNNAASLRAAGPGTNATLGLEVQGTAGVLIGQSSTLVNYINILGSATGTNRATIIAAGTDTNIDMYLQTQGTGKTRFYSPNNTPVLRAAGPGTNIDLTVEPTGTGKFYAPWVPRINGTASSATPAIDVNGTDQFNITALATNITSMTSGLTGSPYNGQKLVVRIKDAGTGPYTIAWGSSFVGNLLTTTVAGKTHEQELRYDTQAAKWVGGYNNTAGY